jgi:hypothetical protein
MHLKIAKTVTTQPHHVLRVWGCFFVWKYYPPMQKPFSTDACFFITSRKYNMGVITLFKKEKSSSPGNDGFLKKRNMRISN